MSSKATHQHASRTTPEDVYRASRDWLMGWAMNFCGNDRPTAEDLVQDTYIQMLTSWGNIRDVEQPERFLYSCLRHGFLRQRRLGLRLLTEELTVVDCESMMLSSQLLRGHEGEWQDNLRAVVAFLCWRKQSVRSASFLLFRFFHGFFPAEIASIAMLPRSAVYDAIDYSRQETKTYLKEPGKVLATHRGAPQKPSNCALLPAENFIGELSETIFASCHSPCRPALALMDRYEHGAGLPIDRHLLAHFVSCRACLDLVIARFGLPPRGSRSLDHTLAPAPRSRSSASRAVPINIGHHRSLQEPRLHCEEATRQRPRAHVLFAGWSGLSGAHCTVACIAVSLPLVVSTLGRGPVPGMIAPAPAVQAVLDPAIGTPSGTPLTPQETRVVTHTAPPTTTSHRDLAHQRRPTAIRAELDAPRASLDMHLGPSAASVALRPDREFPTMTQSTGNKDAGTTKRDLDPC